MEATFTSPIEEYFDRFRRQGQVLEPIPAPRYGLRRRIRAHVRNALPRPVYEAAIGRGYYGLRTAAGRNPGRRRLLPDFLIIGGAKCGTTSLYDWLSRHPAIAPASTKEVHFFDYNYYRREDWYRSHFPLAGERSRFEDGPGRGLLTGEASVSYLSHRWAPARVARLLPNAKLIVALRNPVDRAYSQFQMSRWERLETFERFEEAIAWEHERLRPELERVERDPRYNSWPLGVWSYLHRSRYAQHLQRWLDLFSPEQFLFLRSEDMFADPRGTLELVDRFLGLPVHLPAELLHLLDGGRYAPLSAETRAQLGEYFKPQNERLYELIGTDFGWDA